MKKHDQKFVKLVLEGGGMRGIYTAGVLDFFMEKGLIFKSVIGVSAGAGCATSYVTNQPYRMRRIYVEFSNDPRMIGFKSYFKTKSFFGIDFIFREIPDEIYPIHYDDFPKSKIKMEVSVTEALTGKPAYFQINDLRKDLDKVIASASIPIVSPLVEIEGTLYADGGVSDPIPMDYSFSQGFGKQVLVLTRNYDFEQKKDSGLLTGIMLKKYPMLQSAVDNRYIFYNQLLKRIKELEKNKEIVVLRPSEPLDKLDKFEKDPQKLDNLYLMGYRDAKHKYLEIVEYAKKTKNFEYDKKKYKEFVKKQKQKEKNGTKKI